MLVRAWFLLFDAASTYWGDAAATQYESYEIQMICAEPETSWNMRICINIKIAFAATAFLALLTADGRAQDYFVQSSVAVLWKAPHEEASPVGILVKGTKVKRLGSNAQWCLVQHQQGRGWVLRMLLGDRRPYSRLKSKPSGLPLTTPSPAVQGNSEKKTRAGGFQPAASIENEGG